MKHPEKPVSEFLEFEELKVKIKTKTFRIYSKRDPFKITLGYIKWHGPWRKYVFNSEQAIFDNKCLADIMAFNTYLMDERKYCKWFAEQTGFDLVREDGVS